MTLEFQNYALPNSSMQESNKMALFICVCKSTKSFVVVRFYNFNL